MHVRVSKTARNGRLYQYVQLVESFRQNDGTPTHRVVAHLGALTETEIANLKTALAANRDGKRVAIARGVRFSGALPKVVDNLQYLDIAVLHEIWKEWRLPEMLEEVLPKGEEGVSPAKVITALTLQRCVAPGSKLSATQWFPRTALPELLDVAAAQFNNTRLHRVLDDLDSATPALMAKLPRRYLENERVFATLFLDVTDTWFVGDGPELAQFGKTKEGLIKRKIGIVLLCNEHGFPLRWSVIAGTTPDSKSMSAMIESVARLDWIGDAPLVCDRAMGKTAQIRMLAASGVRFLTALTRPEFPTYAPSLPDTGAGSDAAEAVKAVTCGGMMKVANTLYVMDLGTLERVDEVSSERPVSVAALPDQAMKLGRQVRDWVESGQHGIVAAGRAVNLSKTAVAKYRLLCSLDESIQREILDGKANERSLAELWEVARLSLAEQGEAFRALLASPARRRSQTEQRDNETRPVTFTVRLAAYFNPEQFEDQRKHAKSRLDEIDASVKELNTALAKQPSRRRTRDQVAVAVDRILREYELLGAYTVTINEQSVDDGRPRFSVELKLDEQEWARRRRYDGFTVLVGHRDLTESAEQLCRLYRGKDVIEKDFQTIKSVVDLRPVHHRTDGKVRAHVTLCMLALLLERTLARRLKGTCSADFALETLATCHLNRLKASDNVVYGLTDATTAQQKLLRTLHLERILTDDVVEALSPR